MNVMGAFAAMAAATKRSIESFIVGITFIPRPAHRRPAALTAVQREDYIAAVFDDSTLRLHIYDEIVRTSEAPSVAALASKFQATLDEVRTALRRMHDAHMLVLQPSGELLMASPFSAVPTPFVTEVGRQRWFGNCVWDALGILATLHVSGRVLTSCAGCGDAMTLEVMDRVSTGEGIVHFALPARRWWDDIVFN